MNRSRKPKHTFAFGAVTLTILVLMGVTGSPAGSAASTPSAVDLGTLGGTNSFSAAVSDSGQVVGYSLTAGDLAFHAFSWTRRGSMVDLGTLGGAERQDFAVNELGHV